MFCTTPHLTSPSFPDEWFNAIVDRILQVSSPFSIFKPETSNIHLAVYRSSHRRFQRARIIALRVCKVKPAHDATQLTQTHKAKKSFTHKTNRSTKTVDIPPDEPLRAHSLSASNSTSCMSLVLSLTVPTSTLRYGASSGLPCVSAARCAVTRHINAAGAVTGGCALTGARAAC